MKSLLKSFGYAFSGIRYCIENERNMRIHTVITLYVLLFARFFDFTREDYALLMLTIGGVIALEAVNTAVEVLCEKVSSKEDSYIKHAKDIAAGAVLIAAVVSVVGAAVAAVVVAGAVVVETGASEDDAVDEGSGTARHGHTAIVV